ncbi:MAG: NADH-quinone oxidoreductase subunit N [Candidatus Bathyarchaeota archaeon]|nr:NADH-quinone oxidoreductase subunit N [Candidatus Bathyarchaeum sp.]
MNIVDVLLPTIVFTICALVTIPLLRLVRKTKINSQYFMVVWMLFTFAAASVGVYRIADEFYNQPEPFIQVFTADTVFESLSSSFLIDAVSVYMVIAYMIVGSISCVYGVLHVNSKENLSERYYALLLIVTGAVVAATFTGDLLTLFIFWEAAAAGACFIVSYRKSKESLESALKYLVMVIIASGSTLYGLSLIYGLTGSLNFWTVKEALLTTSNPTLLLIAFAFIVAGYAIETAIVPFHMWMPDAYTAAPDSGSAFLSAIVDQGSYYVILRVLLFILTPTAIVDWRFTVAVFSAITMIAGNMFALAQQNVKRMVSYVCIADIGYNLIAITSITSIGLMGNLFFFFVAALETALAFMVIGVFRNMGYETLEDMSGMGRKMPLTSLAFIAAALSFSGVPLFAGFIAKYMVFTSVLQSSVSWLAIVGVLNSVLQSAYFLRVIHYFYAKPAKDDIPIEEPKKLLIPIYCLVVIIVVLGLFPDLALSLVSSVATTLPV